MSAKSYCALLALALAGCMPKTYPGDPMVQQEGRAAIAAQCEGRDGWSDPAPPAHVFANVYMVGTCGITSLLITSPEGHILIDGATAKAAPGIAANIAKLGFDPRQVKYILNGHEHDDHAAGLAELKKLTGAHMVARTEAKAALESGKPDADDPQHDIANPFQGVKVDRIIADGETLRLGRLQLKAIATPGHTKGSTSWSWRSCEGNICHGFVFADSLTAISADNYRFSDHPEYVAMFRNTYDRVGKLANCDILITPHPSASALFDRLAGKAPLVNPAACSDYAAGAAERLSKRLADEAEKK